MKQTLLSPLLLSSLFLVVTGCQNAELTHAKLQKIETKLDKLEQSLAEIELERNKKDQATLKTLAEEREKLSTLLKDELQVAQTKQDKAFTRLQAEQNAIRKLLKANQRVVQTKPLVVYKNKKEIAKLQDKLILGRRENAIIEPYGLLLRARVDTGADTSSIDARNIQEFERDGKKWVRFALVDRKTNKPHVIEKKILRRVNIIQSSAPGEYDARLVVKLKIKIGDFSDFSEFTLTDREHMDFPLLIGRSFLQDIAVVDVSGQDLAPIQKEVKR